VLVLDISMLRGLLNEQAWLKTTLLRLQTHDRHVVIASYHRRLLAHQERLKAFADQLQREMAADIPPDC
jgi:hypothetical protein